MAETILVTGAAGFIGRYVAQLFFEKGWTVVGLDASSADAILTSKLSSYYRLALPSPNLGRVISGIRPQVCVHCAGPASVGNSMEDPASDFNHSVMATFNLLDALRINAPGCRFLYPSSAAVYGNPSRLPVNESQIPNPISPYGFHKLICEQLAAEFHKVYGLPTSIVRIFSAYGVGLKRQVLWDICQKASAQNILRLQGTGNESRDFIHVSDIALAILLLAEKSPCKGDIYNLASGTETTIRGLQEIIVSELGLEIPVEFNGLVVPGDPINWRADVSRISLMGFRPEIDLKEGVASYAKWYLTEVQGRG